MTIYLGQQQSDGAIRYVATSEYNNSRITSILRNFYSTESRATALIELGNLVLIRPTPYGKSTGYGDKVHCYAEIRDDKKGKGSRLPRYGSEAEFLKLEGHLFLFREGVWLYHNPDGSFGSLPERLPEFSNKPLEGLEFYYIDEKCEISYFYGRDYKGWDDIVAKSNNDKTPIFVFRNNKLIRTINHPLNQ